MTNLGEKGPGKRVLICPECLMLLDNAGRGRAVCTGSASGKSEHSGAEMVPYVPEASAFTTNESREAHDEGR